jgi:hypothetical protein
VSVTPYQDTITQTLDVLGWRHMHVRPIFDARGKRWITPTTAVGWPDVTAVHRRTGIVAAIEIKTNQGPRGHRTPDVKCGCCPTPDQLDWLQMWHHNPGAAAVVFRPSDDWNLLVGWFTAPFDFVSGYGWLPEDGPGRHQVTVRDKLAATAARITTGG